LNRSTDAEEHAQADTSSFAIGDFILDLDRGALLRDDQEVPLRPKSYQVLVHLVQNAGALVTKEDLLASVWPDVIVTDDSLTQCLIDIRKALGDRSRTMIRTVPRRGFVLEAPVEAVRADRREHPRRRRIPWLAAAALVLVLASGAAWWAGEKNAQAPSGGSAPEPNSVAVLPFEDMSPDGDMEYFAAGIAEEILNQLAQNTDLVVIARTSSFSFRNKDVDIPTIARRLNVAKVLEGSVRVDNDTVRITAQLVDGESSAHIWSKTYDRVSGDLLAIQDEISRDVAGVLHAKLAETNHAAAAHDNEAYQAYFRGRFFYNRRGPGDLDRASDAFEQALTLDPALADAWVGLAGLLNLRAQTESGRAGELLEASRAALERAMEIDPDNVEALARLAQYHAGEGQMEKAWQYLDRAKALGHNNALVQGILAGVAYWSDEPDKAIAYQQRAVELDPLNLLGRTNLANYFFGARRFEDSLEECRIAQDLASKTNPMVLHCLSQSLVALARYGEAAELLEHAERDPDRDGVLAIALWALGRRADSDAVVQRMTRAGDVESAARLAEVEGFKGNSDDAFRWLDEATERYEASGQSPRNSSWYISVYYSPWLDGLRDDDRWTQWTQATDLILNGNQG
jgi:TolB-like protein/DNA-binding winged helix-turn-helix (wHTH) protein/thioredoxin-like negative regulator of GroEL